MADGVCNRTLGCTRSSISSCGFSDTFEREVAYYNLLIVCGSNRRQPQPEYLGQKVGGIFDDRGTKRVHGPNSIENIRRIALWEVLGRDRWCDWTTPFVGDCPNSAWSIDLRLQDATAGVTEFERSP